MNMKSHVEGSGWPWGISTLHDEATNPEKERDLLNAAQILVEHKNKKPAPTYLEAISPTPLDSRSGPRLLSPFPGHSSIGARGVLYGRDPATPVPYKTSHQVTIYPSSMPPAGLSNLSYHLGALCWVVQSEL